MYQISPAIEQFLKQRDREWQIKIDVEGTEYSNSDIISIEIENQISTRNEFLIGTAIPSHMILKLRTREPLPTAAKIIPYIGAALTWRSAHYAWEESEWPWTTDVAEWLPLGEFYIDERKQVSDVWTYSCYGKLVFADVPYISSLTYPATMEDIWDEICTRLGYTYEGITFEPYTVPVAPTGFTMRQIMGYIAGAHGASVYEGLDGVIRWKKYTANDTPVFEMTMSDYIRVAQTNPIKTYTRVVVYYEDYELEYEAGEGDENHTLYVENPFASQKMANALLAQLNGFSYMPVEMDTRAFPHLEPGDIITFAQNESPRWKDAYETWETMDQPWEGMTSYKTIILRQTLTFQGGMKMKIESPSLSEQQSEIPIEGTLTRAIRRVNENALKKGRTYYGFTISDEYGARVQRSDGKSQVTLNSDIMEWVVDGTPALYYDAIDNKLKFRGDIIMEGGSISWESINKPTPQQIGAVADNDPRLSKLNQMGDYLGQLSQGQIEGLPAKLANINDIGEYIGALSQGQIQGLSQRLTNITPTGVYTGTVGTDQLVAGSALIGAALIDKIKASQIDVSEGKITTAMIEELIVGQNVQMGPNATISWQQVTNQPNIPATPSDIGAIAANDPKLSKLNNIGEYIGQLSQGQVTGLSTRLTHITPTGVYTGTVGTDQLVAGSALIKSALIESIEASKIQVGTLTGFTLNGSIINGGTITGTLIRTASSGNRIEMSSAGGIRGYSNNNQLHGMVYNLPAGNLVDMSLYHDGSELLEFYDEVTRFIIRPGSNATTMGIGQTGKTVYAFGTWDFSNATTIGLVARFA